MALLSGNLFIIHYDWAKKNTGLNAMIKDLIILPLAYYFSKVRTLFLPNAMGPDLQRSIMDSIIRSEKLAVAVSCLSFTAVIVIEAFSFSGSNWLPIILLITIVWLLSVFTFLVRFPAPFSQSFYSGYYITVFFIIYHYSFFFDPGSFKEDLEIGYLLHLSLVLTQSIRPGRFPGLPVILFLVVHTIYIMILGYIPLNSQVFLRLFLFIYAGLITLFIESILYYYTLESHKLRIQQQREEKELELAQKVQSNLFPVFKENDKLKISYFRSPENKTGGDFFDVIQLREGNLGFFFTDISGHGVSSAMMSAAIKVIISSMPYRLRLEPEQLLTYLDDVIHREYNSHHATAVYVFFDFHDTKIHIANAGHPPILFAGKGEKFIELETEGSLVGFNIVKPIAKEITLPMQKGDRILIYSDGFVEYRDKQSRVIYVNDLVEMLDGVEDKEGDDLIRECLQRIQQREDFGNFHDDVMITLLQVL